MRATTIAIAAVATLLVFEALPGSALAEPGLTVDPQSPAGVEYAVPLDQGRGHGGDSGGSGGGGSSSGGNTAGGSPPLFGSGIKPVSEKSGQGSPNSSPGNDRTGRGVDGLAQQSEADKANVAAAVSTARSYSTVPSLAIVVAAILLAGVGFGLLLRTRTRSR